MTPDDPSLLGLKIGTVMAGLIGGVASLAFITNLTPRAGFTAVLGGAICAGLLTPAAAAYLAMTGSMENALAFFLGVCGMNFVGGMFKISEGFMNSPVATFKELLSLLPFRWAQQQTEQQTDKPQLDRLSKAKRPKAENED